MSLEFGMTVAGLGALAGWLVVLSEQVRAGLLLRRERTRVTAQSPILAGPHWNATPVATAQSATLSSIAPAQKAAAYQNVLDSFGHDLEQDIAQWESVLCDFPQVLFPDAADLPPPVEQPDSAGKPTRRKRRSKKGREKVVTPERSRIVLPEERDMIGRLAKTGFTPEEIAMWLNLPLERVQELLCRLLD